MKTRVIAAACLVAGAMMVPVAGYTADSMSKDTGKKETVKESVKDAVITTKIKAEYAKDKQVSAMNIKVDTDGAGVVTLSGNAKSQAEADKAVSLAKSTSGVTSVVNNIQVAGSAKASK